MNHLTNQSYLILNCLILMTDLSNFLNLIMNLLHLNQTVRFIIHHHKKILIFSFNSIEQPFDFPASWFSIFIRYILLLFQKRFQRILNKSIFDPSKIFLNFLDQIFFQNCSIALYNSYSKIGSFMLKFWYLQI